MLNRSDEFTLAAGRARFFRGLAVGLMVAAIAAGQDPAWEKVALGGTAIWQDPDWDSQFRPNFAREPSRLAADDVGRIYLSNGAQVLIGNGSDGSWNRREASLPFTLRASAPVAAAGNGLVQTRSGFSRDGGATWDTARAYGSAFALLADGTRFLGSAYDAIERAEPRSGAWDRVHMGNTFGDIQQFAVSDGPNMFALPMYAPLLFSRDSGRTWAEWSDPGSPAALQGGRLQTLAMDRRGGNSVWLAARKSDRTPANVLIHGTLGFPTLDTLSIELPDSSITAIVPARDGSLWLGTEGQGVWVRSASGTGFTRMNGGLDDPFVESMVEASDGRIFALTRSGLYRRKAAPTVLKPRAARIAASPARAMLHVTGLPRPPSAMRPAGSRNVIQSIQADGRIVILPASHP